VRRLDAGPPNESPSKRPKSAGLNKMKNAVKSKVKSYYAAASGKNSMTKSVKKTKKTAKASLVSNGYGPTEFTPAGINESVDISVRTSSPLKNASYVEASELFNKSSNSQLAQKVAKYSYSSSVSPTKKSKPSIAEKVVKHSFVSSTSALPANHRFHNPELEAKTAAI